MKVHRRPVIGPFVAWGMGGLLILSEPFSLAARDPGLAIVGLMFGLTLIAKGIFLWKASRAGPIPVEPLEVHGRTDTGWVFRRSRSVGRAYVVDYATLVAAVFVYSLVARRPIGPIIGAICTVLLGIGLAGAARDYRSGHEPSLSLTPDGLLVRRSGRNAFAPWSTIEDARSPGGPMEMAASIRFRFSDPEIAKSMWQLQPGKRLIWKPRWHLYWTVLGTGVEGPRLAKTIMLCARDPLARTQVGTEHGLVALGLVGAGGIEPPTFSL